MLLNICGLCLCSFPRWVYQLLETVIEAFELLQHSLLYGMQLSFSLKWKGIHCRSDWMMGDERINEEIMWRNITQTPVLANNS